MLKLQPHEVTLMKHTARLHAAAFNADPFAYGRIMNEMRHGYVLRSDIHTDAENILTARDALKQFKYGSAND